MRFKKREVKCRMLHSNCPNFRCVIHKRSDGKLQSFQCVIMKSWALLTIHPLLSEWHYPHLQLKDFFSEWKKRLNHFWQVAVLESLFFFQLLWCVSNIWLFASNAMYGLVFRKGYRAWMWFSFLFPLKIEATHASWKLSRTWLGTYYSGTSVPSSTVHYSQHGETLAKTSLCLYAVFSRKRTFKSYH